MEYKRIGLMSTGCWYETSRFLYYLYQIVCRASCEYANQNQSVALGIREPVIYKPLRFGLAIGDATTGPEQGLGLEPITLVHSTKPDVLSAN